MTEHRPPELIQRWALPSAACVICRRASIPGLRYRRAPICAHCAPHALSGEMMLDFSEAEQEAIDAGGVAAGEYLDEIGKTDLAVLTSEEWTAFLGKFLTGYSEHMREEAKKYPPF